MSNEINTPYMIDFKSKVMESIKVNSELHNYLSMKLKELQESSGFLSSINQNIESSKSQLESLEKTVAQKRLEWTKEDKAREDKHALKEKLLNEKELSLAREHTELQAEKDRVKKDRAALVEKVEEYERKRKELENKYMKFGEQLQKVLNTSENRITV